MRKTVCDRSHGFRYFPFGPIRCGKRPRHRGRHRARAIVHEGHLKHTVTVEWFANWQDYR